MKKRKPKPLESWITPERWSFKYPGLERSTYLVVFAIVALATLAALYILHAR